MKLELVKIAGKVSGYNLVPENREEKLALNAISELHLGAGNKDENPVRYDGLATGVNDKAVTRLKFMQGRYDPYDIESRTKPDDVEIVEIQEDFSNQSYHRCSVCGSKNVQRTAFVKPNESNKFNNYASDCDDVDDCWCEDCRENVALEYVESKPKKK